MRGFYQSAFEALPEFLKRRIHPLEFAIRDFVGRAGRRSAGHRVLDAGAGEARFAPFFGQARYVAVDSGQGDPAWDYSRLHVRADLAHLPFRDGSFDLALNLQVLEHVADPQAVLRELARVLRKGGELLLTAPQGWHEHQQPHDHFRFTRFSLRALLERAGFEEIQIEPLGGYFHYLGHRVTYLPKILFQSRRGGWRLLLFPLELLSLSVFCFLIPLLCYYLDPLDRKREFTLGYACQARKKGSAGTDEKGVFCNPAREDGIFKEEMGATGFDGSS